MNPKKELQWSLWVKKGAGNWESVAETVGVNIGAM